MTTLLQLGVTLFFYWHSLIDFLLSKLCLVPFCNLLESFRLEYEYEIEYEYDFQISNQLSSQSPCFSQLLISRGEGFRNNVGVLCDDLEYALSV